MIGSFIVPRGYETSRLLRKQLMEEQEQALELERRHLAELQLARKQPAGQTYFGYSMDDLKVSNGILFYQFVCFSFVLIFIGWFACFSFYIFFFRIMVFLVLILIQIIAYADPLNFPSAERFNYLLDVLNSGSAGDDSKPGHTDTSYSDQERYELTTH
jgi:hypothetical protein